MVEVLGEIRFVDRGQRGKMLRFCRSRYAARLCGDDLIEQPDSQTCVTGYVIGFGLGQEGGGLGFSLLRQRQACLVRQGAEDRGELGGV